MRLISKKRKFRRSERFSKFSDCADGWDAIGDWSGGGAGTDSPVANDDDDDHGDEEDQAGRRRANDERQLLLNAGVVFLCRKGRETHSHTHTAQTYG